MVGFITTMVVKSLGSLSFLQPISANYPPMNSCIKVANIPESALLQRPLQDWAMMRKKSSTP